MTTANISRVLDELRQEYAEVEEQVERVQLDLENLEARQERLLEAIESLERLSEREPEPEPEPELEPGPEPDRPRLLLDEDNDEPPLAPDSPIAKYVKRGGEGRRLSSTQMAVDVLDEVDKWVSRDEFKEAFFKKFPREELERFWERPDNALVTALTRAAKDNQVGRGVRTTPGSGNVEVFGSMNVIRRHRQQVAQKKLQEEVQKKNEEERGA